MWQFAADRQNPNIPSLFLHFQLHIMHNHADVLIKFVYGMSNKVLGYSIVKWQDKPPVH